MDYAKSDLTAAIVVDRMTRLKKLSEDTGQSLIRSKTIAIGLMACDIKPTVREGLQTTIEISKKNLEAWGQMDAPLATAQNLLTGDQSIIDSMGQEDLKDIYDHIVDTENTVSECAVIAARLEEQIRSFEAQIDAGDANLTES